MGVKIAPRMTTKRARKTVDAEPTVATCQAQAVQRTEQMVNFYFYISFLLAHAPHMTISSASRMGRSRCETSTA